jgi:putative membrane protein insertion efficiency factor
LIKRFFIAPIKGYQLISKMLPKSCRYYPTCSEYALWQFDTTSAPKALLASTARILRCNQLFAGGIDYPIIRYKKPKVIDLINYKLQRRGVYPPLKAKEFNSKSFVVKYWIVPEIKRDGYFFVIKDLDETEFDFR